MPSNTPGNLSGGFSWHKVKAVHNRLRRFAIRSRIINIIVRERRGPDERLAALQRETETGTTWEFIVGGGGIEPYSFQVSDASTGDPAGARIGFRFGSVSDEFNPPVSPVGMVPDNDPLFTIPVTSSDTVSYLDVTVKTDLADPAYGQVLAVDPAAGASVPAHDYAGGHFYYRLRGFTVDVDNTTVTLTGDQTHKGSLGFVLSGESGLVWSKGA